MAPRAAPAYAGTRLSKKFTAKCEANQPFVDTIAEKREKAGSSNFGYTLKRAAESICQEKTPLTSYEQVVALKGVGPSIARMLGFSKSFNDSKENNGVATKNRKKGAPKRSASDAGSVASSPSSTVSVSSLPARRQISKQRQERLGFLSTIKEKPTRKELAYQKAVQESESWKGRGLKWRLVLLIDQRERKAEHYASKVQQCGIPTEIRSLPIGDMCWIAQGFEGDPGEGKCVAELMLGTIIERKEVNDLKSSLFGTRYHEQQLRLKDSGQPQVIFLVEGDTKKDQYKCPAETLHSTMWAIRIEKQNQVIQTAHTEETVQTLRRMHRRMLQRTFPTAFFAEALPSFTGPEVVGRRGRQRDSFGEQRRKRRRRLESLHGLVFDEEPIPMAGMARFVTYKELRAKVERDREAGRRTVGSIHQAMLKQVATISDVKIIPISSEYPTANALLQAYNSVPDHSQRKRLLEGLDLSSSATGQQKSLGPRSAAELYIAYGLDKNRRESIESNGSGSTYLESVAKFRAEKAGRLPEDNGSADSQQESSEHSKGSSTSLPPARSVHVAAKASSGRNQSNNAQAKTAKKPPPVHDMVELLSSDDDEKRDFTVFTSSAPAAKRRRSSQSFSTCPAIQVQKQCGARSAAAVTSVDILCDDLSSDDEELDELLKTVPSKKKAAAISTTEVIEID